MGAGGMGRVHARHYAKFPDVELRFFELDPERASKYAADTGAIPESSIETLLSNCDAIDICLPTHLHREFAEKSIQAGKPTLCEKPLCRTTKDSMHLVELADKLGVKLMPGQVVRYFPEFKKAHGMVADGAVGKASAIRTRRGGAFPKNAGAWMRDPELSGGVLLDLAVHDFDWLRWTFGEVTKVYSNALTYSGMQEMDYALTTLTFESGAIGHVEATWADPAGFRVTFEISGSDGFIEHDSRQTPSLRTSLGGANFAESPMAPGDDPYFLQLKGFLESAFTDADLPVSALEGAKAVAIAEAALESARQEKAIAPAISRN